MASSPMDLSVKRQLDGPCLLQDQPFDHHQGGDEPTNSICHVHWINAYFNSVIKYHTGTHSCAEESPLDLSFKIDVEALLNKNLPPTKIKRTYKCKYCSHETSNPRIHLYHRISIHNHKLRVVECDLCVYACQYKQKLKRHRELVHFLKD